MFLEILAAFKSKVMLEKANYCHEMNIFFPDLRIYFVSLRRSYLINVCVCVCARVCVWCVRARARVCVCVCVCCVWCGVRACTCVCVFVHFFIEV